MSTAQSMSNAAAPETVGPADPRPSTTERLAEKTHAAVDKVAESLDKTEADLRAQANAADAKLREIGAQAQRSTEKSLEQARTYAQEHPFAAAGIAFAAGLVVAGLLRR